jgi:hypothetical protein
MNSPLLKTKFEKVGEKLKKLKKVGKSRDKVDYITPHVDELTPVLMNSPPCG